MNDTIIKIADSIKPIFDKYGVKHAGIFGSYARNEARPDSDVDILVSLGDKPFSVWDLVSFKEELSVKLEKPVDLVSDRAIVSYFRDYIYRDLKTIYGTR